MTNDQLSQLWAFSRGDLPGPAFEEWFLAQNGLEEPIGEELHWAHQSGDYSDRDEVWKLRKSLLLALGSLKECECPAIRDAAAIPMGGDFFFEKVFDTLDQLVEFGPEKWWLYISKCRRCATVWLIAQDDRIYDEFYFQRIDDAALAGARLGRWPPQFQTYEDLLSTGRNLSNSPRSFDPMASCLRWAVEDLLKERPAISAKEIGNLLGLSEEQATALTSRGQSPFADDNH